MTEPLARDLFRVFDVTDEAYVQRRPTWVHCWQRDWPLQRTFRRLHASQALEVRRCSILSPIHHQVELSRELKASERHKAQPKTRGPSGASPHSIEWAHDRLASLDSGLQSHRSGSEFHQLLVVQRATDYKEVRELTKLFKLLNS